MILVTGCLLNIPIRYFFLLSQSTYDKENILKMCTNDTKQNFHQSPKTTRNEITSFIKDFSRSRKMRSKEEIIIDDDTCLDKQQNQFTDTIIPSCTEEPSATSSVDNITILDNNDKTTARSLSFLGPALVARVSSPLIVPSVYELKHILVQNFKSSNGNHNNFYLQESVKESSKLLKFFYNVKESFLLSEVHKTMYYTCSGYLRSPTSSSECVFYSLCKKKYHYEGCYVQCQNSKTMDLRKNNRVTVRGFNF